MANATGDGTDGALEDRLVAIRAASRLARRIETAVTSVGLSQPQYRILAHLARGPSFPSDIADRLELRRPNFTQMADVLVGRGLLDRSQSDTDRRRIRYELTDAGRGQLDRAETAIGRILEDTAATLDEKERSRAWAGLRDWSTAMDRAFTAALASETADDTCTGV